MTLGQLKQFATNYSHLNTKERIDDAVKEHTQFSAADFKPGKNLYVLSLKELEFDYRLMKHQPRIENKDDGLVKKYKNQALNGVKIAGKTIFGIREPVTVYAETLKIGKFTGILGHHRFLAAKEAGYKYIIVFIDDNFPLMSKDEQIDYLMEDNAGALNQKSSCAASVKESLKETLRTPTFMSAVKLKQANLQNLLESCKVDNKKKAIREEISKLESMIRKPLLDKIKRWMPSHDSSYHSKMVTTALNEYRMGNLIKLYSHSKAERQGIVVTIEAETSLDWGQKVVSNNVQINLPIAEFVKRIKEFKDQNNGILPSEFVFATHIPAGATDYSHLMDLRRRTASKLKETLKDVYPEVERKFEFLGQIINPECDWSEDTEKLYDLDYVESYFKK